MRLLLPLLLSFYGCAPPQVVGSASSSAGGDGAVEGPSDDGPGQEGDTGDTGDTGERGGEVTLFINELMPANSGAVDVDGDTPDWFELYNPGDVDVSLEGFTVTDDLDRPDRVRLDASLVVPAGGFLVIYASGDDAVDHVEFQLSSEGEALGLYFPDGSPSDRLTFGAMPDNLSLARSPDGGPDWQLTATPTPGADNEID